MYKVRCLTKAFHAGTLYLADEVYEISSDAYKSAPEGIFEVLEKPKRPKKPAGEGDNKPSGETEDV